MPKIRSIPQWHWLKLNLFNATPSRHWLVFCQRPTVKICHISKLVQHMTLTLVRCLLLFLLIHSVQQDKSLSQTNRTYPIAVDSSSRNQNWSVCCKLHTYSNKWLTCPAYYKYCCISCLYIYDQGLSLEIEQIPMHSFACSIYDNRSSSWLGLNGIFSTKKPHRASTNYSKKGWFWGI